LQRWDLQQVGSTANIRIGLASHYAGPTAVQGNSNAGSEYWTEIKNDYLSLFDEPPAVDYFEMGLGHLADLAAPEHRW
jgi:hypothetical protein